MYIFHIYTYLVPVLENVQASGGVKLQWATMLEVFCTANYGDNMKLLEKSFFQDGELALICNEKKESPEYGVGENLWDWGAPIEVKEVDKEELKIVKTVQDESKNEGQSIYIKATNSKGCNYAEAPFSCQADTRWPDANDARAGSSYWWVPALQDMKVINKS